jgi:hypothetical protein
MVGMKESEERKERQKKENERKKENKLKRNECGVYGAEKAEREGI